MKIDDEDPTADVNFYTGASVQRDGFLDRREDTLAFSMEPGACNLCRLNSAALPVLNNHSSYDQACVGCRGRGRKRIDRERRR